jgi:hypothetical protein
MAQSCVVQSHGTYVRKAAVLAAPSRGFAQFSTTLKYMSTIDCIYYAFIIKRLLLEGPMNCKTQPPWDFLLSASRNSLQSYELSRLSHAANLRKEIAQLLDSWLEENTAAMLARWLMEQRERPASDDGKPATAAGGEHATARRSRAKVAESVSDNVFADSPVSPPVFRVRP